MFLRRCVGCDPVLSGMWMLTVWKDAGIVIQDYTVSQPSLTKLEFQYYTPICIQVCDVHRTVQDLQP